MKFLLLLCILCAEVGTGFSLDREAFTFTRYNLDVRIEPAQQRLAVRGSITLRNDSSTPQKNASLQIFFQSYLALDPVRCQASAICESALRLGYRSHRRIVGGDRRSAEGSAARRFRRTDNWLRGRDFAGCHTPHAHRHAPGSRRAQRLGSDQHAVSAVRGAGYVAWYPVAMEAGNLSEGRSLFEVLGRWKQREQQAEIKDEDSRTCRQRCATAHSDVWK